MTWLGNVAIFCAGILAPSFAVAAGFVIWAAISRFRDWRDTRAIDRAIAMRRHPAGSDLSPRNLPIADYAVMVAAEKVAADHARVELADDDFIWALVEVDHR